MLSPLPLGTKEKICKFSLHAADAWWLMTSSQACHELVTRPHTATPQFVVCASVASYGNSEVTPALDSSSSSVLSSRHRLMASARRTLIESVREATREWLRNAPAALSEIEIDQLRKKIRTALVRTEEKGRFVYLRTFYELMKRRNADVLGLEFMMTAIENVMKYASNALKYKDRREYRTIKKHNGFYKCNVEALFGEDVEVLFRALGFDSREGELKLAIIDEERIVGVQTDLMFAQEEIRIILQLMKTAQRIKCELSDVIEARMTVQYEDDLETLVRNFEAVVHISQKKPLPRERATTNQGSPERGISFNRQMSEEDMKRLPPPVTSPVDIRPRQEQGQIQSGSSVGLSESFMKRHATTSFPVPTPESLVNESYAGNEKPGEEEEDLDLYGSGPQEDFEEETNKDDFNSLLNRAEMNGSDASAEYDSQLLQAHHGTGDGNISISGYLKKSSKQPSIIASANPSFQVNPEVTKGRSDSLSSRERKDGSTEGIPPKPVPRKRSKEDRQSGSSLGADQSCKNKEVVQNAETEPREPKAESDFEHIDESALRSEAVDAYGKPIAVSTNTLQQGSPSGQKEKAPSTGQSQKRHQSTSVKIRLSATTGGHKRNLSENVELPGNVKTDGGTSSSGSGSATTRPVNENVFPEWTCQKCTFENKRSRKICEICSKSRDFDFEPTIQGGTVCQFCSFINPIRSNPEDICPSCKNPYSFLL